jgi:hypothetical protein
MKSITTRISIEIAKSTRLVMTELAGIIIRGKYTLVIRLEFPTKLRLASLKELDKNCQGSIPTKTMRAYGAVPAAGNLATRLKIKVKIIVVRIGRTILQAAPITVCL